MGSGKTTVGKLLAVRLGYSFIDMDAHIEEKLFKSVSQIFTELGEEEFRLLEQQSLHEVAQFDQAVISTGGGAPCFFDNMDYMNRQGDTVYLKLSPVELAERLEMSHANKRPLLANRKGEELQQFIAEGLAKREAFYAKATYTVSGDIESTVSQICVLTKKKK
jgi:shikimate kinase